MLLRHLTFRSLLFLALPLAYADVEFTSPAAGTTIPVGPIEVAWKDSGLPPAIAELTGYILELMVGGNEASGMANMVRDFPSSGAHAPQNLHGKRNSG